MPIQSVRRIYMNTESARNIFNYQPGDLGAIVVSQCRARPPFPAGPGIEVRANLRWTDGASPSRLARWSASRRPGRWPTAPAPNQTTSADGDSNLRKPNYPVPNAPLGALIGRVGTGAPFLIGGRQSPSACPSRGRLYLSVNDDDKNDNSGGFRVEVVRNAR